MEILEIHGNTFPFQHQFIWFLLTCFFFTNTKTWGSRHCHCNQDTLHPRGPPHTSCYNTALAFVKLAVFTWPSACCVQGAACEAVPLRCQSPLPSHVAGLPANLAKSMQKFAKCCKSGGNSPLQTQPIYNINSFTKSQSVSSAVSLHEICVP